MSEGLQPKPVPKPAPGQSIPEHIKPGEGKPPMQSGRVYMTDQTRKSLESVGWKEGDPVPGDLGVRLKQLQEEVMAQRGIEGTDIATNWKPVDPNFVNIEDLPTEQQDKVRQYLQEFKVQAAEQKQIDAANDRIEAQIPASIQGEQRDLMRQQILQGEQAKRAAEASTSQSSVVDDRIQPAPTLAEKMETAAQMEQARQSPEPAAAEPEPQTVANGLPAQTNCQRCSWPLSVEFDVAATDEDKQIFLAGVLGLKRFEKRYSLLGGNLVVVFRSLTSQEAEILQTQLGHMARQGRITGDAEYWMHLMELRLVIATHKVIIGGSPVYKAPPAEDFKAVLPAAGDDTPVEPTGLMAMREYFYEKGAAQEPVRRMLGNTHQQFQRLVEYLETMTNAPDFWKGIELPV